MENLESVYINNKDYVFLDVVNISDNNEFTVDIEVEDEHNYILSSGIISHNTTSLIPEVTNGIEPLFAKSYIRKDRIGNRIYLHPKYEQLLVNEGHAPDWFVDAYDLTPEDHLKVQVEIQKYVDNSVSKTINMPKGTTPEQLSNLLLKYIRELKGATVYVDGSRGKQILNRMSDSEAIRYLKRKGVLKSSSLTEDDVDCSACNSQKSKN